MEQIKKQYLPVEIVEHIIDFIDYKKYHYKQLQQVNAMVLNIQGFFEGQIPPSLVYHCWRFEKI